jgi:RNA polymerase sigma-70 factor (ECF subfamily)
VPPPPPPPPAGPRAATPDPTLRDRELVAAAREGESWATAALYRRHRRMAYRIASRVARPADREDLVQDAFLEVLSSLKQLRNPELFGSWLASVVARTAARRFRRVRRMAPLDGDVAASGSLASSAAGPDVFAELGNVHRLLELLPIEVSLVFVLRRVERMSIDEVAARIGRSVATVKRRLSAAERLLDQGMARGPAKLARARRRR